MGQRLVGNVEVPVGIPAVGLFGQPDLVLAERRSMSTRGVLLVRAAVADVRAHEDQRRTVGDRHRLAGGLLDPVERHVLADVLDVPLVGLVALGHVLGERLRGRAGELDLVVVVERDQAAEAEVAGERGGLGRDALLMSPSEAIVNV